MRYLLTFALILGLPWAAFAADYRGDCTVAFQGSSTLHDIHGKASCRPFTASKGGGSLDLSRVSVAVAGMDTGNAKRDQKMREMFDEKKFPVITASTDPVSLDALRKLAQKGSGGSAKVNLRLKIRDIEKPVTATVTNFVETDSRITADVAFTLSLAEYHLQPPSLLGLIKVDDKVPVKATVLLNAQ